VTGAQAMTGKHEPTRSQRRRAAVTAAVLAALAAAIYLTTLLQFVR